MESILVISKTENYKLGSELFLKYQMLSLFLILYSLLVTNLVKNRQQNIDMFQNEFELVPISQYSLKQVIEFNAVHHNGVEPLCKYVKYSREGFSKDFFPLFQLSYESGFSYATKANNQLASLVLAVPFATLVAKYRSELTSDSSSVGAPVFAVLGELEHQYKPEDPEKTLYIFIITTTEKFKAKGLVQKMLLHIEQKATREGFSEYYANSTGKISQRVFAKVGYVPKKEVWYRTFEWEGKLPFENLTQADCAKLMVKKIGPSSTS